MTRSTSKSATKRRRGPSGQHSEPRRKLSAPREVWEVWDRAAKHALEPSWADWARNVLTVAAAEELGIDPLDALSVGTYGLHP